MTPKIHQIYLFTNRNTLFFDERGEQIHDLQSVISWAPLPSYDRSRVQDMLERVMEDQPEIFIARWQEWFHPITLDEFASLIGSGPWYWEHKREKPSRRHSVPFPALSDTGEVDPIAPGPAVAL